MRMEIVSRAEEAARPQRVAVWRDATERRMRGLSAALCLVAIAICGCGYAGTPGSIRNTRRKRLRDCDYRLAFNRERTVEWRASFHRGRFGNDEYRRHVEREWNRRRQFNCRRDCGRGASLSYIYGALRASVSGHGD